MRGPEGDYWVCEARVLKGGETEGGNARVPWESTVVLGRLEDLLGSTTDAHDKSVSAHVDQYGGFSSSTFLVSHNQPRTCCAFGQLAYLVANEEHDKHLTEINQEIASDSGSCSLAPERHNI